MCVFVLFCCCGLKNNCNAEVSCHSLYWPSVLFVYLCICFIAVCLVYFVCVLIHFIVRLSTHWLKMTVVVCLLNQQLICHKMFYLSCFNFCLFSFPLLQIQSLSL